MVKLPKFLFCENPILTPDLHGREFILHTRKPFLLTEIFQFENLSDEKIMEYQRQVSTFGRLDYPPETFFFIPVWIEPGYDKNLTAQKAADDIAGLMRRMADWYEAYLKWEDS